MIKLWSRLIELYGQQWERSYGLVGGASFKAWSRSLKELTVDDLKNGLTNLIKDGNDFPPNLVKFLRLCREKPEQYPYPEAKFLPPPVRKDPNAKEKFLSEARELGYLPQVKK